MGWKSYELEAAVDIIKNGIEAHEACPKT